LLMAQGGHYAMLNHPMTRADLDAVIRDRPIAITAHDHHTVWANTAALKAAGILHGMACPPGHDVVMGADGLATGELREFEALAPVVALGGEGRLNLGIATGGEPAVPPTDAERASDRAKILAGLRHCAAHGITSMVTMDGNRYTLELLSEIRDAGDLCARVKVPFHFKPHMGLEALERASAMTRDFNDNWLQSGFVKLFMDGVIDSRTAYMLRDYPGHPGHRSVPLFAPDLFKAIATEADRRGLQIAVHAIGDGAVRTTIEGYDAARAANGARDSRHRIEHIEMIDQSDVSRLGPLGLVASLQPPHAPGAMDFGLQPTLTTIGAARMGDIYLSRSLRDAGAKLAFGSDWPVTDVSVLRGLQAALTRPVFPGGVNESIGLMDSLFAYTAGGAFAAHIDHLTGQIVAGLAGDLVVLDGDIETVDHARIGLMGISLTVCGGRITHENPVFGL
jgi:predicted amidohydrolase YtcJ